MNSPLKIEGKGISRILKSRVIQSPLAGVTDYIFLTYFLSNNNKVIYLCENNFIFKNIPN